MLMSDNDIESLRKTYNGTNADGSKWAPQIMIEALAPYFPGSTAFPIARTNAQYQLDKRGFLYTYDGISTDAGYGGQNRIMANIYPGIYLKNGMIISATTIGNAYLPTTVLIDTNGNKKPDRLGYDVWMFYIGASDKTLVPGGPNMDYFNGGLGNDYAKYALIDKCPTDDTKGYWECLPKV